MKLPLSWLMEHVHLSDSVEGIAETLVRLGHEVEGIETPRASVRGVRVGHILSKEKHPDADKLSLLTVDIGAAEPLSIVCGASNMDAGDRVPVATVGTSLPNGLTIKKGRIRGQESCGMCCSEAELGLADDAAGLLILSPQAPVGAEVGEFLGLEEAVIEVSITPNRGDCMSLHGIARDLAAVYDLELVLPDCSDAAADASVSAPVVKLENATDCPLYLARRIDGVTVGDSPAWMQQRLTMAGMRPVNGVVDVLNYIMLDMGQPMHAFDAACLSGGIAVRSAHAGEAFAALDGRKLALDGGDLVITDDKGVIALAGIMGSEPSGVTGATTAIVLESAFFRPARISLSRRSHGMVSEASMRFERGIDGAQVALAMQRASRLIVELFGGQAGTVNAAGSDAGLVASRSFSFPVSRIDRRLGIEIDAANDAVLERMGFGLARDGGTLSITVPSHRHDVSLPEDISEEYARVVGFDAIPEALPPLNIAAQVEKSPALDIAVQGGFNQLVSYAFVSASEQRLFTPDDGRDIMLANPISEAMAVMRRSIWPGMLAAARHNLNRQQDGLRFVEHGRTYESADGDRDALAVERNWLGWLMAGEVQAGEWYVPARSVDFFDLKGAVEAWLARMGLTARFVADDGMQGLQAGQGARIVVGRGEVGRIGRVTKDVCDAFDIEVPVFVAEIGLDGLPPARAPKFAALPEFPGSWRDLVFLFDRHVKAEDIVQTAVKAGGSLVTEARIFDRYDGKGVPAGKVSLGVRFALQAADRTLTQQDSDAASQAIVDEMTKRFGAVLRG
jgi:phenylalanyl-tRNA synthetase beta chain